MALCAFHREPGVVGAMLKGTASVDEDARFCTETLLHPRVVGWCALDLEVSWRAAPDFHFLKSKTTVGTLEGEGCATQRNGERNMRGN